MYVLLTCAGRRNYLVHLFKAALGDRGRVIACDSCPSAPALAESDESVVVPRVDHPDSYDVLVSTCRERRVRLRPPPTASSWPRWRARPAAWPPASPRGPDPGAAPGDHPARRHPLPPLRQPGLPAVACAGAVRGVPREAARATGPRSPAVAGGATCWHGPAAAAGCPPRAYH